MYLDAGWRLSLETMVRIVIFLLISSFGLASMLGHAGFHVLGLHSHCHAHLTQCAISSDLDGNHSCHHDHAHHEADPAGSDYKCHHHHHHHHHHHRQIPISQDTSDDCTICQFLSLAKAHSVHTPALHCFSAIVPDTLVTTNDIDLSFDFSLRPRPRGPPVIFA